MAAPKGGLALLAIIVLSPAPSSLCGQEPPGDWLVYGGDAGGSRYSPLADINAAGGGGGFGPGDHLVAFALP